VDQLIEVDIDIAIFKRI